MPEYMSELIYFRGELVSRRDALKTLWEEGASVQNMDILVLSVPPEGTRT